MACLACVASLLFAAEPAEKNYQSRRLQVGINYPADWNISETQSKLGGTLVIKSSDDKARVKVEFRQEKKSQSACELLASWEAKNEWKNLIAEEQRRVSERQLRAAGASDACIGAYKAIEDEEEVFYGLAVYTVGNRVWILEQYLKSSARELHGSAVSLIAKTFKIIR